MLLAVFVGHDSTEEAARHASKENDDCNCETELVVESGVSFEKVCWHEVITGEHAEESKHRADGREPCDGVGHDVGEGTFEFGNQGSLIVLFLLKSGLFSDTVPVAFGISFLLTAFWLSDEKETKKAEEHSNGAHDVEAVPPAKLLRELDTQTATGSSEV